MLAVVTGIGRFFPVGEIAMKFYFTNSKLRENHFSTKKSIEKYQISKSRAQAPLSHPSGAHDCSIRWSFTCEIRALDFTN